MRGKTLQIYGERAEIRKKLVNTTQYAIELKLNSLEIIASTCASDVHKFNLWNTLKWVQSLFWTSSTVYSSVSSLFFYARRLTLIKRIVWVERDHFQILEYLHVQLKYGQSCVRVLNEGPTRRSASKFHISFFSFHGILNKVRSDGISWTLFSSCLPNSRLGEATFFLSVFFSILSHAARHSLSLHHLTWDHAQWNFTRRFYYSHFSCVFFFSCVLKLFIRISYRE